MSNQLELSERQRCCRYCHPFMGEKHDECHCVVDGWEEEKVKKVTEKDCESCEKYDSRYIDYPISVQKINVDRPEIRDKRCGQLVKIRPCGKEYEGKTYLGIFLGNLPYTPYVSYNKKNEELDISCMTNPAIFVPELKRIIFGMESWWGYIESEKELKDISDDDIENQWYVKMLKGMDAGGAE